MQQARAYTACLYYVIPIGTCKKRNPHFSLLPQPYSLNPKLSTLKIIILHAAHTIRIVGKRLLKGGLVTKIVDIYRVIIVG